MSNGTIALFGAGGAVGIALAQALDDAGATYREVGRTKAVRADFFTGEGVREAAQGVEEIFYVAGAPYTEFFKHPIMVRHALDAAQAAGVKRFVSVLPGLRARAQHAGTGNAAARTAHAQRPLPAGARAGGSGS